MRNKMLFLVLMFAAIMAVPATAAELVELPHPSPLPGERFAFDVASCDGLMAVGRPFDAEDGSVAIYKDGALIQEIFYPAVPVGAEFGHTVALSPDCQVLAVGAPGPFPNAAGVAFAYEREPGGGQFILKQALAGQFAEDGDQVGQALAVSPDGNHIAVGAHPHGKVYVWDRIGPGHFFTDIQLVFSDSGEFDYTGYALAFATNKWLVVTSPDDFVDQTWSGSLYLFENGGLNVWGEKWKKHIAGESRVGYAVSASGRRIAVASFGKATAPENFGGAVYMYRLSPNGSDITLEERVMSPQPEVNAQFGQSVALLGNHLLVGEPFREVGANNNMGAWNLFRYSQTGPKRWVPVHATQTPANAEGFQYGFSSATYGGMHLVGAPFSSIDGDMAGWAGYLSHSSIFSDGFETGSHDQWKLVNQ